MQLLVDKYRPNTFDEYVWLNKDQKEKAEEWIKNGSLPHLLFIGKPGTGKTSLAMLLLEQLKVHKADILYIPASKTRKVDEVVEKIAEFSATWPIGDMKYVLLDEADALSMLSQKFLRGEMVDRQHICRYILTANYPEKIMPAIHDRCITYSFETLDETTFTSRIMEILITENIDVENDFDNVMAYINKFYPNMRKCINAFEKNIVNGRLLPLKNDVTDTKDYLLDMVELFKQQKYTEARKLIVSQAQLEEYEEIFRFCYKNLELFGVTEQTQNRALVIIRNALYYHSIVADPEINLAAMLAELTSLEVS